jgi:hypothetical protein
MLLPVIYQNYPTMRKFKAALKINCSVAAIGLPLYISNQNLSSE